MPPCQTSLNLQDVASATGFVWSSAAEGTLQTAGSVLGPSLGSGGPNGRFSADKKVKVGLSLPPAPANPALVGAYTHHWEGAGRKGAGTMGTGR